MDVYKIFSTKGADHPDFLSVIESQLHFLQMDPAVPDDFPTFWHTAQNYLKAQVCDDGEQFWMMLAITTLQKVGVPDSGLQAEQERIFKGKLLTISKKSSPTVQKSLGDLLQGKQWQNDASLSAGITHAANDLHMVLFPEQHAHQEVQAALTRVENEENMAQHLLEFPRGREFFKGMKRRCDARRLAAKQIADWGALLASVERVLNVAGPKPQDVIEASHLIVGCDKYLAEQKPCADTLAQLLETQKMVEGLLVKFRRIAILCGFALWPEVAPSNSDSDQDVVQHYQ